MKRILFYILASHLLMSTSAYPQAGQTGLSFLKLGVGARALGMGEAYSALASDPSATYYNPAALRLTTHPQVLVMHKEWIQGVKSEFLSGLIPADPVSIGVSLNSANVSDIELRNIPGPPLGTFGSHDLALGVSLACSATPELNIGVTGKYLFEKLYTDETTGFGIDLGATYLTPWNIQLAGAVCNIGSMNEFRTEAPVLPRFVRFGAGYSTAVESMDGTVTFGSDVVSVTGEGLTHLHVGGEFDYRQSFAVRLGYQTGYEAKNFSAGAGFRYGVFRIDYAFVPFTYDLGSTHTFSLGINFE